MPAQHHRPPLASGPYNPALNPSHVSYGNPDRIRTPGPVSPSPDASARARSTTSAPLNSRPATISAGASGSTGTYGTNRSPCPGTSTA